MSYPPAALNPAISWQTLDDRSARATLHDANSHGIVDFFFFDANDRVTRIEAMRYMGGGAAATRQRWLVPMRTWDTFHGIQVPIQGDVIWQLPQGEFNYFQWQVTSVDYQDRLDAPQTPDQRHRNPRHTAAKSGHPHAR